MISLEILSEISISTGSKIVMLVLDGLGGLPDPKTGKTELETAEIPNINLIARSSICGLSIPVSLGITPGSGAGHLSLFGYDPIYFDIGRGILEAMGVDYPIEEGDIAARGNFCTVDDNGIITDRRAGRITTEKCSELCNILGQIKINGIELIIQPVKEHRFLFIMRGENLSDEITETDPQKVGYTPLKSQLKSKNASRSAEIVNEFTTKAYELLTDHKPANMVLLRGFSRKPCLPSFGKIYKLKSVAIAVYPMYRGLARLVGMDVINVNGTIKEQCDVLQNNFNNYDFFFVHIKRTDSAGEDGNFDQKVKAIEEFDLILPGIFDLKPDVLIITGDHSTPAILNGHSWHPVPFLLYSKYCRPDRVTRFSETSCLYGSLGTFQAINIMPLAMANALKLNKFGA